MFPESQRAAGVRGRMPNNLWGSLPAELSNRITLMVRDRVYEHGVRCDAMLQMVTSVRQLNHSFADCMQPLRYMLCPLQNPHHANSFVKGVILAAWDQIIRGAPLLCPFYSSLYTTVYMGCTNKPPGNQAERYYNALASRLKELVREGTVAPINTKTEEVAWLLLFLYHVFRYLDRYYVQRMSYPRLTLSLKHWYNEATTGLPSLAPPLKTHDL